MSYGKTYHLIHASFSQIVEVKAQTAPSFAAAVRQLLLNQDGDGVTVRLWNADTGEYLDRRVFISLSPVQEQPSEADNGKARKRNGKDQSDEKHVRSHFGGKFLEAEDDAEPRKATSISPH